jgi:hypothetical protein
VKGCSRSSQTIPRTRENYARPTRRGGAEHVSKSIPLWRGRYFETSFVLERGPVQEACGAFANPGSAVPYRLQV